MLKEFVKESSGILMALCFMLGYLPQIIKIIKTESSTDLSPTMVYLGLGGYIFGMIYMLMSTWGVWWFANYLSGIISSIILLIFYYKHK